MKTRKHALCLVLSAVALPVASAAAPPGLDGMIHCAALDDSGQRLACYDREMAPHVTAQRPNATTPVTPPATPPVAAPTAPAPARTLGEEQLPVDRRPAPPPGEQALTAQITALATAGSTHFVTLDNGQVWRHENAALGSYLKVGESVTITRAAMGSYRLTRDAGQAKNWIRASRVR